MNEATIKIAREEAKRFLKRIDAVFADEHSMKYLGIAGTKLTGSLRRASMDLTRALAEMRKS